MASTSKPSSPPEKALSAAERHLEELRQENQQLRDLVIQLSKIIARNFSDRKV